MAQIKVHSKSKINIFVLVIASVVLGAFFGYVTLWYINLDQLNTGDRNSVFAACLGALLAVIFVLLGILFNSIKKYKAWIKELRSFKNYVDELLNASTETEIYKVLFEFVSQQHFISGATLFYINDELLEDSVFPPITNNEIPICNMSYKNCPVIKYGNECCVKNIQTDINCAYQLPEYRTGGYVCLAISDAGHLYGVLQLYSGMDSFFDDSAISNIKSYIEIVKPILKSSKTLSTLDRKASTDRLTKLYNRTFLDPYLDNEIKAANVSSQQLSLIILDIDHFKRVNDSFGHSAGDHVLVFFSKIISDWVRDTDLVARYGGEEFIVVLPATNTKTAEVIAERIRQMVENTPVPDYDGVQIPGITCSLGISTYPLKCNNKDSLIKTADTALYKAKETGRNRTKIFNEEMLNETMI